MEATTPTKDDVVNAVLKVCKRIPGWRVTKDWLEDLYDHSDGIRSKDFDAQLKEMGELLRYSYLDRHICYHDGIRLDHGIFQFAAADNFIHLISWPESVKRGYLTNILGHAITS